MSIYKYKTFFLALNLRLSDLSEEKIKSAILNYRLDNGRSLLRLPPKQVDMLSSALAKFYMNVYEGYYAPETASYLLTHDSYATIGETLYHNLNLTPKQKKLKANDVVKKYLTDNNGLFTKSMDLLDFIFRGVQFDAKSAQKFKTFKHLVENPKPITVKQALALRAYRARQQKAYEAYDVATGKTPMTKMVADTFRAELLQALEKRKKKA